MCLNIVKMFLLERESISPFISAGELQEGQKFIKKSIPSAVLKTVIL